MVIALTRLVSLAETLKIEKRKSRQQTVSVIAAIVMTGLGVTMMITSVAKIELVQQSAGIILILSALCNIWYVIRLKKTSQ